MVHQAEEKWEGRSGWRELPGQRGTEEKSPGLAGEPQTGSKVNI